MELPFGRSQIDFADRVTDEPSRDMLARSSIELVHARTYMGCVCAWPIGNCRGCLALPLSWSCMCWRHAHMGPTLVCTYERRGRESYSANVSSPLLLLLLPYRFAGPSRESSSTLAFRHPPEQETHPRVNMSRRNIISRSGREK